MHYMTFCLESKCRSFPTVRVAMAKKLLNLRWIKWKVKRRASRRSLSWLWVKNAAIFCKYSWMWNTRTFILHGLHPVNKMLTTQLRRDQRQDLKSPWEWLMNSVWMRKRVPLFIGELGFILFAPNNQAAGKTRVWIRRLPKLLFFQLQRVAFDPETKAQYRYRRVQFSQAVLWQVQDTCHA